jgi:hypothetical protein
MENQKKNNAPKFNAYWIYGVVITLLLGMSLFGGDNGFQNVQKTNISEFERFLNDGDINEVIVINKNLAQISLTPEALNKPVHERAKSTNFLGQENLKGPHYQFEVGNLELFQLKLEKAESNNIAFRHRKPLARCLDEFLTHHHYYWCMDFLNASNVRRGRWRCRRSNF